MKKLLFILLVSLGSLNCSNNDSTEVRDLTLKTCDGDQECDDCVTISKQRYEQAITNNYELNEVKLNGDCLEITFSASGCSGSSWETDLIDMGAIAESFPVQRFVRLSLTDEELCEAWITKTVSFNISPLQVEQDRLYLNFDGWEGQILYKY